MVTALGVLKWTPEQYWRATFYEYTAAMKGHLISQGVDLTPPITREEFLTMKAEDDQRNKRWPDAWPQPSKD